MTDISKEERLEMRAEGRGGGQEEVVRGGKETRAIKTFHRSKCVKSGE